METAPRNKEEVEFTPSGSSSSPLGSDWLNRVTDVQFKPIRDTGRPHVGRIRKLAISADIFISISTHALDRGTDV
ncbi:hypothetical protein EYF80_064765 [Liparis tanakae]|uniref:Uncharacterized protein n=1 Tax=Liparis tanakae TaxID=230148 RepID=A0A4Z2E8H7_9TELE|nr:hypothetical protein EYF80_064765 [Liparis tanakae]